MKQTIARLDREPGKVITSPLGSGCLARRFGNKEARTCKVVVTRDTFRAGKIELHYLLFDLGIDVGIEPDELNDGGLI